MIKLAVRINIVLFNLFLFFIILSSNSFGQSFNCLDCHENVIEKSVHNEIIDCASCHEDVKDEEHIETGAKKVKCESCHEDYYKTMKSDIHHRLEVKNSPTCKICHGTHEVTSPSLVKNKGKEICGKCHKDEIKTTPQYHAKFVSSSSCTQCHQQERINLITKSVHSKLDCADCHKYAANNIATHKNGIKSGLIADCSTCHGAIAKEHSESIHGIALSQGIDEAARCWNCHGGHNIVNVKDENSPVHPKNLAATCGACHDNPKLVAKFDLAVKNPGVQYSNSVHGKLIKEGKFDGATCSVCHGVHDIKNKMQEGSRIATANIPNLCGTCHEKESADYVQSIHWIRAKKGVREAPVCNDCHNEHSINQVTSKDPKIAKIEARKLQQKTCVVCHESIAFTERYGTQSGIATLYQDSYHGLAVMRGDPDAAMCVDCHNVHKILPKSHPESSINDKNVTETCGKCHKGSNPTFAKSYSHVTQSLEAQSVENTVSTIYFWFIIVVIGGMFLHNTLIVIHAIRRKKKRQKGEVTIPRFTKNEVIQHILLFTSFIVLVITGFALKYSHSWWSSLLVDFGMTESYRQLTHRVAAVIMMVLGLYHISYLLFTARGRDVLKNLIPKWSDVIEARDSLLYYLNIKSEKPKYDKYDYTEKAEYWALIWGTLVMGVTGLFLWFPTLVNEWAPIWFIKVSEMVHFYEAILASLAILVWHWFFVIFQPGEYPMSLVWIDGKMTLKHYRHHHDKHFRKIILEWYEFKTGKRVEKLLSNSTKLFLKTMKDNNSDPDEVLNKELDNDFELREWLESRVFPEQNDNKAEKTKE